MVNHEKIIMNLIVIAIKSSYNIQKKTNNKVQNESPVTVVGTAMTISPLRTALC